MVARGPDQTIKIIGVVEGERARKEPPPRRTTLRPLNSNEKSPVRCQGWWQNALQFIAPIRIIDGRPDDLRWTAKELTRIDRLVFIYGGRGYEYPVGLIEVKAGQQLHLALHHLKLTDRFGHNVLG